MWPLPSHHWAYTYALLLIIALNEIKYVSGDVICGLEAC